VCVWVGVCWCVCVGVCVCVLVCWCVGVGVLVFYYNCRGHLFMTTVLSIVETH
jgi:hypothetical protein